MKTIIYRGFNITLDGDTLKAENKYFKMLGNWQDLKNRIKQTVKTKSKSMYTTIDNNQRVFQIIDSHGIQTFYNFDDINKVVTENNLRAGYFTIYSFWNNKPKKVGKGILKEMFKAHGIEQEFVY